MRSSCWREPDAKAIAGGQSLVPVMKLRIARPSRRRRHLAARASRCRGAGRATCTSERSRPGWSSASDVLERPALAAIVECAEGDRRSAGAKPRDDRRQHRPRRPGFGHAGRPARARRAAAASLARTASASSRSRGPPRPVHRRRSARQELVTDIVVPFPPARVRLRVRLRRASGIRLRARRAQPLSCARPARPSRSRESARRRSSSDGDPRAGDREPGDLRRPLRLRGVPARARRRRRRARAERRARSAHEHLSPLARGRGGNSPRVPLFQVWGTSRFPTPLPAHGQEDAHERHLIGVARPAAATRPTR